MIEGKHFINGKTFDAVAEQSLASAFKTTYWGLNFTRATRLLVVFGLVPFVSFVKMLKKQKILRKRLFLLQQLIKKRFFFDRILKRNYDQRIDFLVKIGNYRGMRLKSSLPVRGQRTHSNASTASMLNKKRISSFASAVVQKPQKKEAFAKKVKK
jgi:ribosomal protein S13